MARRRSSTRRSSTRRTGGRKNKKFIKQAIKKPGALTKAVGGKPSKNLSKVRAMAKKGGKQGARARFYLNVLKPASGKRRKRR